MQSLAAKIVFCIGLIALWFVSSVQAAEFNQIQTDKSAMTFVFRQMNVPVEGVIKNFTSQLSFDPARPQLAKAAMEIAVIGIDAGSDEGNDALVGKLWFNAKEFPVVRFVSTSIKPLGGNRFEVAGQMSIKGRTHEIKAPGTFRIDGGNGVFEGGFALNRADYGIGEGTWADFGTVANEVQIKFRLVAAAAGKK